MLIYDMGKYTKVLPSGVSYTPEAGLTWKEKYVGNCLLYVRNRLKYITDDGIITEDWLDVEVIARQGQEDKMYIVDTFPIKESEIYETDFGASVSKLILSPDCSKANLYYATIIKYQADACQSVIHCFQIRQTGLVKIKLPELTDDDEVYCYNTGDGLILPENSNISDIENKVKLKRSASEWVIKADKIRYSERDAAAGMVNAITLYKEVGLPVFAFTTAGLLKSLLRECGIPPKFHAFVYVYAALQCRDRHNERNRKLENARIKNRIVLS